MEDAGTAQQRVECRGMGRTRGRAVGGRASRPRCKKPPPPGPGSVKEGHMEAGQRLSGLQERERQVPGISLDGEPLTGGFSCKEEGRNDLIFRKKQCRPNLTLSVG